MSQIIISRTSQRVDSLREYEIYVDGQKINTIGPGEKKTLEVSQSNHEIYIKIDWCKSKKLNINLTERQELKLKCGSKITGIKYALNLFYIFSHDNWVYLDYLTDGEVICNNKSFKTWNEVKSRGIRSFILKYGIKRWGIPSGILYSVSMLLFNSKTRSVRSFIISTIINLLIFSLFGGSLFGFVMWKISEKGNT
jgi:hypothetical protein